MEDSTQNSTALLVVSAGATSSETFEDFRANVRPGDRIRVRGQAQQPRDGALGCQLEIVCAGYTIEEKWEVQKNGCFQDRSSPLVSGANMPEETENDGDVPLCKAWINTGKCVKGGSCKYRHHTFGLSIGKARAMWVAERRKQRLVSADEDEAGLACADGVLARSKLPLLSGMTKSRTTSAASGKERSVLASAMALADCHSPRASSADG
eukprot:763866-Hanusia_phi.AAC.6